MRCYTQCTTTTSTFKTAIFPSVSSHFRCYKQVLRKKYIFCLEFIFGPAVRPKNKCGAIRNAPPPPLPSRTSNYSLGPQAETVIALILLLETSNYHRASSPVIIALRPAFENIDKCARAYTKPCALCAHSTCAPLQGEHMCVFGAHDTTRA